MSSKNRTILVIVCVLVLMGGVLWNYFYITDAIEKERDNEYIRSELERIEQEASERSALSELIKTNPELADVSAMTEEMKREYQAVLEERLNRGESYVTEINEYMVTLSQEKKDRLLGELYTGLVSLEFKDVSQKAADMLDVYDMTDDIEYTQKIVDMSLLSFFAGDSYANKADIVPAIKTPDIFLVAWCSMNTAEQAQAIIVKESQILPPMYNSATISIYNIEESGISSDMNAAHYFVYAGQYDGYSANVMSGGKEYTIYFVYDTKTLQNFVVKVVESGTDGIGDQAVSYKNYMEFNDTSDSTNGYHAEIVREPKDLEEELSDDTGTENEEIGPDETVEENNEGGEADGDEAGEG